MELRLNDARLRRKEETERRRDEDQDETRYIDQHDRKTEVFYLKIWCFYSPL